ncbi:MAG: hypothetical protein WCJ18_04655 [Planctomycetota bacterium]
MALGDHAGKRVDGPRIKGLKTELMGCHPADPWAGVVEHSLDQRPYDIDGERTNLAPLASDRMDGMPADQRRGVLKSLLE